MKLDVESLTTLNAARVAELGRRAIAAGDARIDFSGVARCDSTAIACILAWLRAARAAGRTLELVGLPEDLASLARLYGVDGLIGVR